MIHDAPHYSRRSAAIYRAFQQIASDPAYSVEGRRMAADGLAELSGVLGRVKAAAVDMEQAPQMVAYMAREVLTPLLDGQLRALEGKLEAVKSMGAWYNPFSWGYTDEEYRAKLQADAIAKAAAAKTSADASAYKSQVDPSLMQAAKSAAQKVSTGLMFAGVGIAAYFILPAILGNKGKT